MPRALKDIICLSKIEVEVEFCSIFGENEKKDENRYKQELKYQKVAIFLGIFFPPMILLPLFFILNLDYVKYCQFSFF